MQDEKQVKQEKLELSARRVRTHVRAGFRKMGPGEPLPPVDPMPPGGGIAV